MKRTILLIAITAWVLLPTGTPDDILTFYIINVLGTQLYVLSLSLLFLAMWHYKINLTKIHKAIKQVIRW